MKHYDIMKLKIQYIMICFNFATQYNQNTIPDKNQ